MSIIYSQSHPNIDDKQVIFSIIVCIIELKL
jgi:hypothetical protein